MALVTRTLSVNPVFLQEIKADHYELRQLMHHTGMMLRRSSQMQIEYERLDELFAKLRDQMAMHFSLEEAYGYFEDAIREAPRLNRRAERLRAEHGELYETLSQLADVADDLLHHRGPAEALARLAGEFQDFSLRFQEHELRESELILEALDDDIGAGD